jgi:hypothetical protein
LLGIAPGGDDGHSGALWVRAIAEHRLGDQAQADRLVAACARLRTAGMDPVFADILGALRPATAG